MGDIKSKRFSQLKIQSGVTQLFRGRASLRGTCKRTYLSCTNRTSRTRRTVARVYVVRTPRRLGGCLQETGRLRMKRYGGECRIVYDNAGGD